MGILLHKTGTGNLGYITIPGAGIAVLLAPEGSIHWSVNKVFW